MSSEVIDNPSISARFEAADQEAERVPWDDLTVRQRLLRRAMAETATIDLGTPEQPIPVEIRIPLFGEIERLVAAQLEMVRSRDPDEVQVITREICEIIGSLCKDPELGPDYWIQGGFSSSVIALFQDAANEANAERVMQARAFRLAGRRAKLSAALPLPGEAPS